jgi:hypothetical protein
MGIVQMGPPHQVVLDLRDRCGLRRFVETGTYLGETTAWAAEQFACVSTIERSPALYAKARAILAEWDNVECLLGNSRELLVRLAGEKTPTLYWLDAHWSGGETAGKDEECPLLAEIAAIGGAAAETGSVLLIDDARLFLAPPPLPHQAAQWPDLWEVLSVLKRHHGGHFVIHADVIFSLPVEMKDWAIRYFQALVSAPSGSVGDTPTP